MTTKRPASLTAFSSYISAKNKLWLKQEAHRRGIFVWELLELMISEAAKVKR